MAALGENFFWRSAAASIPSREHESQGNQDALLDWPGLGVWAVADGMGGHQKGERASRIALDALSASILRPEDYAAAESVEFRFTAIERALALTNNRLVQFGQRLDPPGVVGCTLAAVIMQGELARILWVGDARVYLLRDRALHQITADHAATVPWQDPASPGSPPRQRRVLTQALGAQPDLSLSTVDLRLEAEDRLLLCTDGLYKQIEDVDIAAYLCLPVAQMAEAAQRAILRRGAADDVTFIAVECHRLAGG